MGTAIPPFRIASSLEEKEWKSFRNSLGKPFYRLGNMLPLCQE